MATGAAGGNQHLTGGIRPALQALGHSTVTPESLSALKKNGYRSQLQVDLPVPSHYLRVGGRDNKSNRVGVVELPLPLAEPTSTRWGLSLILFT